MKESMVSKFLRGLTIAALAVAGGCTRKAYVSPIPTGTQGFTDPNAHLPVTATPTFDALDAQSIAQPEIPAATNTLTSEPTVQKETLGVENWKVKIFNGATNQMKGWVENLKTLDPIKWPVFPNVDNLQANFYAKNGLEYGMSESVFCQQDETCDVPVAAMHYRLITGDYDIPGIHACKGSEEGRGCGIMIINVGSVTANFRDSKIGTGFTVTGRYWNGDKLPEAIWGGLSHVANNMLNLNSELNPEGSVNAGANCSVSEGCKSVDLAFAIVSGNELLVLGRTTVSR